MTIPFNLESALLRKEDLHAMIVQRRVCFDHAPFDVKDGMDSIIEVGLQRNLYAAFQDYRHLPIGDDSEHHEPMGNLHCLCGLFLQSLDPLKRYEHPDPPAYCAMSSPKRWTRAKVLLQIPTFDRAHFGAKSDRHVQDLLAAAECLLKQQGARRGSWEEQNSRPTTVEESCEGHVAAAEKARGSET
jgi:hypothetical protein